MIGNGGYRSHDVFHAGVSEGRGAQEQRAEQS
jgi:hypothetical protein